MRTRPKVSSIRWSNLELFEHAKTYAELHHEKMNAVIMDALSQYLKDKVVQVSKLRSQTKSFSKDSFDTNQWIKGHDARDWK